MGSAKRFECSPLKLMTAGMKCAAALIVAFSIVAATLLGGIASSADSAYAAIYPVTENGQVAAPDAESDDASAATEIADDAVPMSSGLDSAMASTDAGVPLYAFVAVGIVAVAAFFAVSTRKLNANISEMSKSIR